MLTARGLAGSTGLYFYFFSIVSMPLGSATTIFFIGPTLTAIFAYLVLGEVLTRWDIASFVACLVGVVLVSRPEFIFGSDSSEDQHYAYPRYIPVLSALAAAVILAIAYCLVRVIGKTVHFMVHVTYFGFYSSLISAIVVLNIPEAVPVSTWTPKQWLFMAGVGLFAFIAQCFLNAGLQLANAGPATLMRNLDIVFAFVAGVLIFNETPSILSIIGAILIFSATASVALIKWQQSKRI
eukprot:jgi/Hompol1/3020/HPOL_006324-RA